MQNIDTPTPTAQKIWTVLSLIQWATGHLKSKGFEEARLNVELLLAHIFHIPRIGLYTSFDRPLNESELAEFKALLRRRLAHEPVQYILGETEFMGLPFWLNSSVLIPRPETELLVERAVGLITQSGKAGLDVLDIGTGSGNIAVATAVLSPSVKVTSVDISEPALELARKNAERHGTRNLTFVHADVLSEFLPGRKFDVIVSNPPYVSLKEFETLQPEVRDFEPRLSVTDEGNGFRFITRISEVASEKLQPQGVLLIELAYNQAQQAREIVRQFGLDDIHMLRDYAGIERIIEARRR